MENNNMMIVIGNPNAGEVERVGVTNKKYLLDEVAHG